MSKLHTMAPRCSTASVHWSEVNTLLSAEQLQRSVQVAGAQPRMTQVWSKLAAGSPLKLGVIGASVAMEGGCQEQYQRHRCSDFDGMHRAVRRPFQAPGGDFCGPRNRGFVLQTLDWFNLTFPHRAHRIYNMAADAKSAKALEPCSLSSVPADIDVVLLDLASHSWSPTQAPASERIMRRLLRMPRLPPLILINVRPWCKTLKKPLLRYAGLEDTFALLCVRYNATCLSQRDAIYREAVNLRAPNFSLADLAMDCKHPSTGRLGAQYVSDIVVNYFRQSWATFVRSNRVLLPPVPAPEALPPRLVATRDGHSWRCYGVPPKQATMAGVGDEEFHRSRPIRLPNDNSQALIRPLRWWTHWDNDCKAKRICEDCRALRACVLGEKAFPQNTSCFASTGGWRFCTKTLARNAVTKPGIVSFRIGAVLRLQVDSTVPDRTGGQGFVNLQYLASWNGMGAARVACVHGCRCAPTIMDARLVEGDHISVDTSIDLPVTPSLACQLEVTNLGAQGVAAKWKFTAVQVGWKASQE